MWRAPLDLGEDDLAALAAALSPEEQARADRVRDPRTRSRFLADHGWRRRLLGERIGRAPAAVELAIGEHGKPRLVDDGGPRFSASRAGGTALYAVSAEAEVGVDLEPVRGDGDLERVRGDDELERLARRLLAPAERGAYDTTPPGERPAALAAAWTRKEAYLKALGTGLVFPLSRLELWTGAARPVRLDGIEVHDVELGPGLAAAVAVRLAPGQTASIAPVADLRL